MDDLRAAMPRRSLWRVAQLDTLRLRLIKLAARVEVMKRKVRLHLPLSTPNQPVFACALDHLRRMLTGATGPMPLVNPRRRRNRAYINALTGPVGARRHLLMPFGFRPHA